MRFCGFKGALKFQSLSNSKATVAEPFLHSIIFLHTITFLTNIFKGVLDPYERRIFILSNAFYWFKVISEFWGLHDFKVTAVKSRGGTFLSLRCIKSTLNKYHEIHKRWIQNEKIVSLPADFIVLYIPLYILISLCTIGPFFIHFLRILRHVENCR